MADRKSNLLKMTQIGRTAATEGLGRASSPAVGYAAAAGMTAMATLLAVAIDIGNPIPNISLLFVVPVVISALSFGVGPSLISAALSALSYNFFLTEPRYSLHVDDPANVWAIALLFVVGLIVSGAAFTSRRRLVEAKGLKSDLQLLRNYGDDLRDVRDEREIVELTTAAAAGLFQSRAATVLFVDKAVKLINVSDGGELAAAEVEGAKAALASSQAVPAGTYPHVSSRYEFWPFSVDETRSLAVGFAFEEGERPINLETIGVLGSLLVNEMRAMSPSGVH